MYKRGKKWWVGLCQNENFCSSKDSFGKMKVQIIDWEEIFVKPKSDKGFISRKKLRKFICKKITQFLKWAKDWNWRFTREDPWIASQHVEPVPHHVFRAVQISPQPPSWHVPAFRGGAVPLTYPDRPYQTWPHDVDGVELSHTAGSNGRQVNTSENRLVGHVLKGETPAFNPAPHAPVLSHGTGPWMFIAALSAVAQT